MPSWNQIEELPPDWELLKSPELISLRTIWEETRRALQGKGAIGYFNLRLKREWAIETGLVENLYSWDRGVTEVLLAQGLHASLIPHQSSNRSPEWVIELLRDQEAALDGLFDFVTQHRPLSTSYIKELHQLFTRHQDEVDAMDERGKLVKLPLLKGEWKKLPNNPRRENGTMFFYCPPEHVASEMDRLIEMHISHVSMNVPPEIEAAWLHHRFTQIHPFQDGNGRVARALATLIFIREGWFPLVIKKDEMKTSYITALEKADTGVLHPLVDLFISIQKAAFRRALGASENSLFDQKQEQLQRVYSVARERLQARREIEAAEIRDHAFSKSRILESTCEEALNRECEQLREILSSSNRDFNSRVQRSSTSNSHWFHQQIIQTARILHYFADTKTYQAWVRLQIWEQRQFELVLSFHSLGFEFVGVMAVSAFIEFKDRSENDETTIDGPHVVSREVFQFSYIEDDVSIKKRFNSWLQEALLLSMERWTKQL